MGVVVTVLSFEHQAPVDLLIEFDKIQGDILIGLQKDVEAFVFFKIADVTKFKRALSVAVSPLVTSSRDVRDREEQIAQAKLRGDKTRFLFLGLNLGFTHAGLMELGVNGLDLDESFEAGAHTRGGELEEDTST